MYCRWPEMLQHISCSDSPNSFWKSLCWPLCSVLVTADREFVFVQLLSCVRLSAMSLTATHQGSPSFIISQSLLRLCPLSQWCHTIILSFVTPSSSCPQSFLESGSFPVSWLFASDVQSYWSVRSVLPRNIHSWFPLGLTAMISLQSKRLSRVLSNTAIQKHQFFGAQPSLWSSSHICAWPLKKP